VGARRFPGSATDCITRSESIKNCAACPLLAQSRHFATEFQCPLVGVKRTSAVALQMSAYDPKRTSQRRLICRNQGLPTRCPAFAFAGEHRQENDRNCQCE